MPTPASLVAVTVLGDDRPGIVADVTSALAGLGCNLEDSTMTLLRGHFAMVVLVRSERSLDEVSASLRSLTQTGELAVDVRPLPEHGDAGVPGTAFTLHVHGADRPGIVAAMTNVVARHGGNIVDLGTRLGALRGRRAPRRRRTLRRRAPRWPASADRRARWRFPRPRGCP